MTSLLDRAYLAVRRQLIAAAPTCALYERDDETSRLVFRPWRSWTVALRDVVFGRRPRSAPPSVGDELVALMTRVLVADLDPDSIEIHLDERSLYALREIMRYDADSEGRILLYGKRTTVHRYCPPLSVAILDATLAEQETEERHTLVAITYEGRAGLRRWMFGPSTHPVWQQTA